MPKKIDAKVKERCVRLVLEHLGEYSSLTAAAEAVARRENVGKESVRRWVIQAQIDGGQRQGATSEELVEIRQLKATVRRLEEDTRSCAERRFSSRGNSTPATGDRGVHRRDARRGPRGRVDLSSPEHPGLSDRRADLPGVVPTGAAGRSSHDHRRDGRRQGP
jgi:transposase